MPTKYDKIGIGYNQTRKADPFLLSRMLHHLEPGIAQVYLDIGCGTGNYTSEFQKAGCEFIGIDPSTEMLKKAQTKNDNIQWQQGTAEHTGLPDNSVGGIAAMLTIHHWTNLESGFKELNSVLKPGGKLVLFTSTSEQMKGYWLNYYFPKMLADSIEQMPSMSQIENGLKAGGFGINTTEKYFIQPDLKDQFLYCGKQNPELYFDENIRKGISSFSALANISEVEEGLLKLKEDIDSGVIQQIIQSYQNNLGDYLFIVAKST